MSGRHHIDKAKPRAKDKDARAKVAERVNITAKEQGECRREGLEIAMRVVDRLARNASSLVDRDVYLAAWAELAIERDRRWPSGRGE